MQSRPLPTGSIVPKHESPVFPISGIRCNSSAIQCKTVNASMLGTGDLDIDSRRLAIGVYEKVMRVNSVHHYNSFSACVANKTPCITSWPAILLTTAHANAKSTRTFNLLPRPSLRGCGDVRVCYKHYNPHRAPKSISVALAHVGYPSQLRSFWSAIRAA